MFIWQDIVIAFVSMLFGFILLPQLRDVILGDSLNVYTAGFTTVGLFVLSATFYTLDLWISVIADIFSGIVWFLLFIFSIMHRNKEN